MYNICKIKIVRQIFYKFIQKSANDFFNFKGKNLNFNKNNILNSLV